MQRRINNMWIMEAKDIRPYLIQKLKDEHRFWSCETDSIRDVPDDIL